MTCDELKDIEFESVGEVIKTTIIDGLNITPIQLSQAIKVPPNRIYAIIQNKREISIDTAIRLGIFLGVSPHFWLNLQHKFKIKELKEIHSKEYQSIEIYKHNQIKSF